LGSVLGQLGYFVFGNIAVLFAIEGVILAALTASFGLGRQVALVAGSAIPAIAVLKVLSKAVS
jgi:hypothetical protein